MGARFMPFGTCLSSYRNGWLWRSLSLLSCILYGIGPLSGRMRSAGSVFLFTEVIRDRTKPVWLAGEALFTKGSARPCQGTVGEVWAMKETCPVMSPLSTPLTCPVNFVWNRHREREQGHI